MRNIIRGRKRGIICNWQFVICNLKTTAPSSAAKAGPGNKLVTAALKRCATQNQAAKGAAAPKNQAAEGAAPLKKSSLSFSAGGEPMLSYQLQIANHKSYEAA